MLTSQRKSFPDQFTFQVSASAGYNSNATFQPGVITDNWGKNHWLGFADKSRQLPRRVADGVTPRGFNLNQAVALDRETKSFSGSMAPTTYTPPMNHSFSMSVGDQKQVFGKSVGFLAGVSYQRSYEYYERGDLGRFFLPGDVTAPTLDTIYNLRDTRGRESVLWGGLLSTTIKLSSNHKIGFNLMHNHSADASARYLGGTFPYASGNNPDYQVELRALEYVERSLSSAQLKGDHVLGSKKIKVDWVGAIHFQIRMNPI